MKNRSQSSMGGLPEHSEQAVQHTEVETSAPGISEEQMLLDYLIEMGFVWQEATKLLNLREHLYENMEMRQRMTDDCRMHFARWLYEHGEIREGEAEEASEE
jgi:hypothetical protein